MEKLLDNLLNKFIDIAKRDVKKNVYDYLILNVDNKDEVDLLLEFIIESKINIDLCLFMDKSKKKKLYIQSSALKEDDGKKIVFDTLRKLHNFWRIKFNKDISYKRASKHSVFFEAINLLGKLDQSKAMITFNNHLECFCRIEIEDEYKKL
jgi:hypothetical protein